MSDRMSEGLQTRRFGELIDIAIMVNDLPIRRTRRKEKQEKKGSARKEKKEKLIPIARRVIYY